LWDELEKVGESHDEEDSPYPCRMVERRVRAPVKTLAEERAMTPGTGKRLSKSAKILTVPCSISP